METHAKVIGHSVEERPLMVRFAGSPSAKQRVLVIAGQHGDERFARRAAEKWLQSFNSLEVHVAVLVDANPDGASRKQRKNAQGVDLNRDHQLLSAPETQAVHAFARDWRPHLIIDVHTYPPRRKHLLAHGLVHANDVFIDVANNPTACEQAAWAGPLREALPNWIQSVRDRGFRADRYTIVTKQQTVRHSTPDVTDARNGLSLSLGVPTVLLEGRERTRFDDRSVKKRTIAALVAALNCIVADVTARWSLKPFETIPARLPIRSRYVESDEHCELEFFNADHQRPRRVKMAMPHLSTPYNTQVVAPPIAYSIPKDNVELLDVLRRHGIVFENRRPPRCRLVQTAVRYVERSTHSQRPPRRLRTSKSYFEAQLDSHVVIPVTPANARLLAVFLEAHSKYALCRYRKLGVYPQATQPYSVLRWEPAEQTTSCAVN